MIVDQNYTIRFPIGEKLQKLALQKTFQFRSSECNLSVSSVPRRTSIRSLHNAEKFSGIKCALPSFTSTLPNTFKGLEKHCTPIKTKSSNSSNSFPVCCVFFLMFSIDEYFI